MSLSYTSYTLLSFGFLFFSHLVVRHHMFMPNWSSPVNPAGRVTTRQMQKGQQTMLDQLTRPKPRVAKKNTEASKPNIMKVANRPKEAERHASHAAPESES